METGTTEVTHRTARPADTIDTVPTMDEYFTQSEGNSAVTLFAVKADPERSLSGDCIKIPTWEATHIRNYSPKTIGGLYAEYVRYRALDAKVRQAMAIVNSHMNEYADSANLCSQYDEAVEALNKVLEQEIPEWGFRFDARSYQYRCVVRRERTLLEEVVVYVEGPRDANSSDLADAAIEDAQYVDEWEIIDEDINESELHDYHLSD